MAETNAIPITYKNNKAEKKLISYNKLWEVAFWGFDTKIGSITNDSTTTFEIQSQFAKNTPEYNETDKRLKLFRYFQGNEIDRAKNGSKVKKFPTVWKNFQKILETDTLEEISKKEFENKLVIKKRPEFMRFLYNNYEKEYKDFINDFDRYTFTVFGKRYDELDESERQSEKGKELIDYYDKKNPLLKTGGVMNRLSRHMQSQLKNIKQTNKNCDNKKIFDSLYNYDIELDNTKLELLIAKKKEYEEFKQTKQLKASNFVAYEQYYKYLRNDCLEKISSDIKQLANLAVYICYHIHPKKPKDFCWDIFGAGIVENLKLKNGNVKIPHTSESGYIDYLGAKYEMSEIDLSKQNIDNIKTEQLFDDMDEMFSEFEDLEEI
ncbi:MAG: hypothetical protein PHR96_05270 [Clostridia bacterium]|nr:hypothetical protein [Clostridia bacterium]